MHLEECKIFLFLKNFFFPFELESLPRAGKPTKSWQQCDIERVRKKVPVAHSHFSGQLLPLWRRSVCPEGRGKGTNRTCSRQQDQTNYQSRACGIFLSTSHASLRHAFLSTRHRGVLSTFSHASSPFRVTRHVLSFFERVIQCHNENPAALVHCDLYLEIL